MKPEYDFSKGKRGAVVQQKGKTRITIYIDDDIIEAFRNRADKSGRGYQTIINQALRKYLNKKETDLKFKETDRLMKKQSKSTNKEIEKVIKIIDKLGGHFYDFIKEMVTPAAMHLFQARGIEIHEVYR